MIIETLAEIFLTAGSATVAKWSAKIAELTEKTLGKLATFVKAFLAKAKSLLDKVLDFIDLFLAKLKKGAKNLFDEFSKIVDEIFGAGKKVEDLPKTKAEERVLAKKEAQTKRLEKKRRKREIKKADAERKNKQFWKDGYDPDPTFSIWGSGKISHPELWENIMNDLSNKGCKVKISDKNLVYGPSPSGGKPGVLTITEDASITALMHEYKHFLDDMDNGFLGFRLFQDPKLVWKMEYDAYMIEIKFLRENKEFDTAKELLKNALDEKRRIEIEYNIKL